MEVDDRPLLAAGKVEFSSSELEEGSESPKDGESEWVEGVVQTDEEDDAESIKMLEEENEEAEGDAVRQVGSAVEGEEVGGTGEQEELEESGEHRHA